MSIIIKKALNEKSNNFNFQPGPTQTGLYSHRSRIEASNFGFKKKDYTVCVAKTKALINFAVTVKLTCTFVFTNAICLFSHDTAQLSNPVCTTA